ncbi:MAG: hypothetical protein GY730_06715 [bacterium]|nr:hypothetical protein [bacterium]
MNYIKVGQVMQFLMDRYQRIQYMKFDFILDELNRIKDTNSTTQRISRHTKNFIKVINNRFGQRLNTDELILVAERMDALPF